jgi:hemerythrin-like metal-binding protein
MFTWSPKYSVGFEEVDFQHQKFLKIADDVIQLIGQCPDVSNIKQKTKELLEYAKWHFETEHFYMSQYPNHIFEDHKAEHKEILSEIEVFIQDIEKFDSNFGSELMVIVKKWFLNHILGTDKKLYNCISQEKFGHIIIKDENL